VREDRVLTNLHLVPPIARKMHKNLPHCFELKDLIGEGNLGLVRAADSYVANQKVPFFKYARRKIRSAIRDSVRRRKWRDATGDWRESGDERYRAPGVSVGTRGGSSARTTASIREDLEPTPIRSIEQLATDGENRRDLDHAIGALDRQQAQVIVMRYFEGKTGIATGKKMRIGEFQTARLHRQALKKMHQHFKLQGRTAA
jgi:RNA polymerase sigma factor (sigma-70 family)